MINLGVAIAAHPGRAELVTGMVDRLGLPARDVSIAWDEKDDIWDTHRRAWEAHDPGGTHWLVLQDDAQVCDNLVPALNKILEWVPPQCPISLYFGNAQNHPKIRRAADTADRNKCSWIVSGGTWWGVGIILPTPMIKDMLTFCEGRRESYDRRFAIWCGANGHVVYYPWPSLIDHVDVQSLVNPARRPGRKAYRFVGENFSALDWDPTGPTVQCGKIGNTTLGTR